MNALAFVPRHDVQRRIEGALRSNHFVVETTDTVHECMHIARFAQYDGIIVDSDSLLFEDVVLFVKHIRDEDSRVALFVLGRYLDLGQRLRLFESGVDDCVREPFFASELAVRVRLSAQLRKAASEYSASVHVLRSGELELDLIRRTASRSGKMINLRPKEFLLLEYLVRNVNRPLTRTMLLEAVWNSSFEGLTNVVDVYISSLRSKIDHGFSEKLIKTTRGVGYTLSCPNGSTLSIPHQLSSRFDS